MFYSKPLPPSVLHLVDDPRNFWGPCRRHFCVAAHIDALWIFGFYRRSLVHEAHQITTMEFLRGFNGNASKKGRSSTSVLITLHFSEFLARFMRHLCIPLLLMNFWTVEACRIFISALEYRNSTFEDWIDINSSRGSPPYFY